MTVAVAIILACTAGYVDALVRITDGAFVANMTGNTVYLAMATIGEAWGSAAKYGSSILAFVIGAVAARGMLRLTTCRRCALATAAAALLVATALHGFAELAVIAVAMGLQDAAVMHFGGTSINTVFMSGDLIKFGDAIAGLRVRRSATAHRALQLGGVWLGYVIGAGAGAIAAHLPMAYRLDPRLAVAALAVATVAALAAAPPRQPQGDVQH